MCIRDSFRREEVSHIIKKCNDFGAGGVSVAIGELADLADVYVYSEEELHLPLSSLKQPLLQPQDVYKRQIIYFSYFSFFEWFKFLHDCPPSYV